MDDEEGQRPMSDKGAVFFCVSCQDYFQVFHKPVKCPDCGPGLKVWVAEHVQGEYKH